MRILHVNKFLYRRGGVESYLHDCVDLQLRAGHEVALFGMQHPDNEDLPYAAYFPRYVDFGARDLALVDKLRLAGRALHSRAARTGIARVIEEFRPDVAHLHLIYHQLSPSVLAPLAAARVPMVMTLHDYSLVCPTYLLLDRGRPCVACLDGHVRHAAVRRCKDGALLPSAFSAFESAVHRAIGAYDAVDLFICPSRFLLGRIATQERYVARLRHLPHFIDTQGVPRKTRPGGPVVFAGRLSAEKGADVLVRAAAVLAPTERVIVAGEGPAEGELRELAARIAPGRVTFAGRLSQIEVRRLVATAAVVAIPSRAYENQPMIALESFGAGVPVVGSNHGALAELVNHGRDGLLVPPDDPVALAAALGRLLAEPATAHEMGAAGRRKMQRDFSPAAHRRGLTAVYAEAGAAQPMPVGAS